MAKTYYVALVAVKGAGTLRIETDTEEEAIKQGARWAGVLLPHAQTSVTVTKHGETPNAK